MRGRAEALPLVHAYPADVVVLVEVVEDDVDVLVDVEDDVDVLVDVDVEEVVVVVPSAGDSVTVLNRIPRTSSIAN